MENYDAQEKAFMPSDGADYRRTTRNVSSVKATL
jgi:hypothetical protein